MHIKRIAASIIPKLRADTVRGRPFAEALTHTRTLRRAFIAGPGLG